jgi:hypothetical protein
LPTILSYTGLGDRTPDGLTGHDIDKVLNSDETGEE